ncbi:hypothetical protein ABPG75_008624 [Micractinium tetrahymenae]
MNRTSPALRLALHHNGRAHYAEHTLVVVPHPDTGALPLNFPATIGALEDMSDDQLEALLAFYGQPATGGTMDKCYRLKAFIGQ